VFLLALLLLPLISGSNLAAAQALNTGTVAGNVLDVQGSIVPNASATLTDLTQNKVLSVKVNGKGEYLFTDVAAGTYSLRITAPTFEAYSVPAIEVSADQNVRVDAKLQPGGASETVTVDAPSAAVDTRSATIATVIDNRLVEDLPIDGNNVVQLAALLPGVSNVNAPTTFTSDTGGPTYNVSGSRSNQNLFLFDGLLWNNVYYNTGLNYPARDALQEVSVLLNNFKAQYGRNVGSIYNVLTKQGSNQVHGAVWEYIQNKALNASDYISHLNPHLVQNQFGATVGGPIIRDKAFFFLAYQDLRSAQQVITNAQTPTLAERGLLSPGVPRPCVSAAFSGRNCASFTQDYDPTALAAGTVGLRSPVSASNQYNASATTELLTQPNGAACIALLASATTKYLPNAEIPDLCFNPVAVNVLNKYIPLPNSFIGTTQLPSAFVTANQPKNDQQGFARVDYPGLGHGHTLDARIFVTNANDFTSNSSSNGTGVSTYEIDANSGGIYSGNIGDTWVLRSNMLNVLRLGYKRYNYTIVPTDTTTGKDLGSNLTQRGYPVLPRFEATNRFTVGSNNTPHSYSVNGGFEADDNFTWTRGNHNLQFGAQYLDLQYVHNYDTEPIVEAGVQNTTASVADFLFGLPQILTIGNSAHISAIQHAFYFYAQDDWRATSRFTINYGLRYELPFNWFQPDGQSVTFIPGYQSKIFPQAPSSIAYIGDPGIDPGIAKTPHIDFAPRFGLAYDLFGNGHTAIRGGFGIFYDNVNANTVGIGQPYFYTATYNQPPGGFSNLMVAINDVPVTYTDRASAQFVTPFSINFADANLRTPYTEAFNFGIQQKIAAATLEINYVGKLGRHQLIPFDQNPAIYDCSGAYFQANPTTYCTSADTTIGSYAARVKYPNYNAGGQGIVDNASIGTSNYNGLQVIYTQRSKKSLSTVASYTYSRSLDEQSNGATNIANVPTYNIRDNYGPSDFQATHVFNMGWVLRLPTVRKGNAIYREVVNGWSFGGVYNVRTGNPFTPTVSGDRSLTDSRTQRMQRVPGVSPTFPGFRHRTDKVAEWFNLAAFQQPTVGTFGNVTRNALYGPAYTQINFRLSRTFSFYEQYKLQFSGEALNAFNTPNLAQPQASFSTGTATNNNLGRILNTVGTNGAATTNGRRIQLSMTLRY